MNPQRVFLDHEDLEKLGVPYTKKHLRDLEKKGQFPKHVKFGGPTSKKFWLEDEISDWIESRIASREVA